MCGCVDDVSMRCTDRETAAATYIHTDREAHTHNPHIQSPHLTVLFPLSVIDKLKLTIICVSDVIVIIISCGGDGGMITGGKEPSMINLGYDVIGPEPILFHGRILILYGIPILRFDKIVVYIIELVVFIAIIVSL
jgi:hypothetical protein